MKSHTTRKHNKITVIHISNNVRHCTTFRDSYYFGTIYSPSFNELQGKWRKSWCKLFSNTIQFLKKVLITYLRLGNREGAEHIVSDNTDVVLHTE